MKKIEFNVNKVKIVINIVACKIRISGYSVNYSLFV